MFRNSSSSHLCSLPDPVSPSVPPVSPQCPCLVRSAPRGMARISRSRGPQTSRAHELAQQTSTRSKAQDHSQCASTMIH